MMKTSMLLFNGYLLFAVSAQAQITSTFDVDADGWTFPSTITHNTTGGNSGGYISSTYSSSATSSTQYWLAPSKFLGNLVVRSLGEELTFSLQQSHAGTANLSSGDIRVERAGTAIVFEFTEKPAVAPEWTTYTIRLDETAGWKMNSTSGALATRAQIVSVLTNITAIQIRASYITNAAYTAAIDDVSIGQKVLMPAPSISSVSSVAAPPGTTVTLSGNNFDPMPASNVVHFGPVQGTVISASATELQVTVPIGAAYGPLTVVNRTTGLVGQSTEPFNPVFANGGRIIPCSFGDRVDISASFNMEGITVADIDGDGWSDILLANTNNQNFSVFRHSGNGGAIGADTFEPEVTFATGGSNANGAGIRAVDLDGDGRLDVISSIGRTAFVGSFVTLRNISTPGNIAFDLPETWDALSDESPLFNVVDLDGDGRPELLGGEGSSGASSTSYLWIAQNISSPGNIEFAASRNFDFEVFAAVSGVTAADLNNDDKPELIVKHNFSGAFYVLENNSTPGNLVFTPLFSVATGIQGGVQVADLNLDGRNDLLWKANATDDVRIRLNEDDDGILTAEDFATQIVLTSDLGQYGGVSLADINGDGKIDIVVADNGNIGVFENVYTGGAFDATAFVSAYLYQGAGGSTYPTSVIPVDINGDGRPEMITGITNTTPNRISIFENRNVHAPAISLNTVSPLAGPIGSSVTITGAQFSEVPAENKVYFGAVEAEVVSASVNELVVTVPAGASYAPVTVRVGELSSRYHLPFNVTFSGGVDFRNHHFAPPVSFLLTAADYDIDVADLNRDGKPDLVAEASGGTYVFLNTHVSGAISATSLTPDDSIPASFQNPRLEDIDGDGLTDILATNGQMRRNVCSAEEITFAAPASIGGGFSNIAFADLNIDGKIDAVMAYNAGAQLIVKENRSRTGAFQTGTFPTLSANFAISKPATGGGVATGDFDNDGLPDVVVTNPGADNLSIFRNAGHPKISTSQFDPRIDVQVGDNPGRIYTADLDVDGRLDLVLYHNIGTQASELTILHNQGSAGNILFNTFTLSLPGTGIIAHIDDVDGDGKPDILVANNSRNVLSIFKNNASPGTLDASSFSEPFNTDINNPRCVYTADINLDGRPEILVTTAGNTLLVFENLVGNPFIEIITQPVSQEVCEGSEATLTLKATGAEPLIYQWQKFNGTSYDDLNDDGTYSGTTTDSLTIHDVGTKGGSYYRCHITSPEAPEVFSDTVFLYVLMVPPPPEVTGDAQCEGVELELKATAGDGVFRWYDVPTGGTALPGQFTGTMFVYGLTESTTFYVAISSGTCESDRVPVMAEVIPLPDPPSVTHGIVCGEGSTVLRATGGSDGSYIWWEDDHDGTPIEGENDGAFTTPFITSTRYWWVSIDDGICESKRVEVIAYVRSIPDAPTVSDKEICANTSATLTASGAEDGDYRWYTIPSGGEPLAGETDEELVTPALSTTTSYFVAVANEGCESDRVEAIVTVIGCGESTPPVITPAALSTHVGGIATLNLLTIISDDDDDLDPSSLAIIEGPVSGADAFIDESANLVIDYGGVNFAGLDQVTIAACDFLGSCTEEIITIEVVGDVLVFNALSPNHDGLNDTFVLQYIDTFDDTRENKVTIFNRWGDVVFEASDYDNAQVVFKGETSSGNALPSGVYFYKIEFMSGRAPRSGYLVLKR